MKKVNLAIIGATGAVGQELLKIMSERNFPYKNLKLLASKRSAGQKMTYEGQEYIIEETTEDSFEDVDIAFFAGGPASRAYGRIAQSKGVVVVDNSSTFRLDDDVPLVVPEVNSEALKDHKGLIASPNCSTTIMAVALNPIHQFSKIKRVIVSTYQAVSGAGKEGIDELCAQSKQILEDSPISPDKFDHQIAFNLIPHIDSWVEDDYTKEEMKMVDETYKIFNDSNMAITATTVRVPVFRSHSESIYIETEDHIPLEKVKELLAKGKGLIVQDDPNNKVYPMPVDTSDKDEIFVGRIRKDLSIKNGINFWVTGDQIRKGAATNTIQIAEELLKNDLV